MSDTSNNLPACWQDFTDAIAAGIDRIILFGPPGTGKTFAGLTMGNVEAGAFRVICNEDMTEADITGHYKPSGAEWNWCDGKVIKAWEGDGYNGGRVVADEVDRASGDVLSVLLAMFDTPESASWTNPDTGQTFRPRPGFSVVMTTNIEDMRELPQALKDRFPVAIRIDQPHPNGLLTLPPDLRAAAAASADADRDRRFSLRAFQAYAKLRDQIDGARAARIIFGSQAEAIIDALAVNEVTA
jgi:midasin (ATPase involved in ribosome maturation)